MKRGTIVVVAAPGAYTGKPRPAVVVQSDLFNPTHASLTICPITSEHNVVSFSGRARKPSRRLD